MKRFGYEARPSADKVQKQFLLLFLDFTVNTRHFLSHLLNISVLYTYVDVKIKFCFGCSFVQILWTMESCTCKYLNVEYYICICTVAAVDVMLRKPTHEQCIP